MTKFIFLLLFSVPLYAQKKVTIENYYDYYIDMSNKAARGIKSSSITTSWLSKNDAIPIIVEEFKNAGYDWVFDNALFKVNDGQYIVISAYSRKSNFGFLYIGGHSEGPTVEDRTNLLQWKHRGVEYISYEETPTGKPNIIYIEKLPENIYILNENCYWYQHTDNAKDNALLITKQEIMEILRKDVQNYLLNAPKP